MQISPRLLLRAVCAASLGFAGFAASAFAGTVTYKSEYKGSKEKNPIECPPDARTLFRASVDYVGQSDFKRGDGRQDALHYGFEAGERIPLEGFFGGWPNKECGRWYLRLGADYERFDFDTSNETRLPNTLQSIAGVIALEYLVKGEVGILIETRPGIYFEHNINDDTFDAPTTIALAYPIFGGDRFYLIVGAAGALMWSPNVIPVVGALWHINDQWDLKAYLPEPRLIYKPSEALQFWIGGELAGGGFKTDRRDVHPDKLSGAVVTYTDVRAGAGITWVMKPLTFDLGAGASLQREFDYNRAGERFRTDPAPYVKLTVKAEF